MNDRTANINFSDNYRLIMDLHLTMQGVATSLEAIRKELDVHNRTVTDLRIAVQSCRSERESNNKVMDTFTGIIKILLIIIATLAGASKVSGMW